MSKIAFIFPGQGAQVCGMGQDFYEQTETGKKIFDMASGLLGFSMPELCFTPNDRLDITEYTQAAMVTASIAMMEVLKERTGVKPDVAAGLSLGEYPAMVAAGVMSAEDAIKTVRQRGILMQEAVPVGIGSMAAVLAMDAEKIEEVIAPIEGVQIANYNCPGQIVITGKKDAIEAVTPALKEAGAKRVLPLNVSGPFHSPFLKQAGEELYETLEKVDWKPLQIPYVTNVNAEVITDISQTKDLLRAQVSSSVMWEQSVRRMIEEGVDIFVEIGPGKTLSGFMRKIDRKVNMFKIGSVEEMHTVVAKIKELTEC